MIARLYFKYTIHFRRFYSVLRYRLFVGLGISLFVGVLDGIGLAMFMPLLEVFDTERSADESSSIYSAISQFFAFLGIPVTLGSVLLLILSIFVVNYTSFFSFLKKLYF